MPCGEVRLVRVERLAEDAVDSLSMVLRRLGVDDTRLEFDLHLFREFH
jgi:hypothetical protein